jgi:hypothetical protein
VTRRSASTELSTSPASAVRTVHAKVSRGRLLAVQRQHADRDVDRVGGQLEPALQVGAGTACASSIAHASSTAIRRSSMSSMVKSSRDASPAVAVRRTER